MVIGDNIAVSGENEAGTAGGAFLGAIGGGGNDAGGNGHNAVHVPGIDLGGSQRVPGGGQAQGPAVAVGFNLAFQFGELLLHLSDNGILLKGLFLPAPVHHTCGDAAAGGHQGGYQKRGHGLSAESGSGAFFLLGFGLGLGLGLEGIARGILLTGRLIHLIGGIGIGGFFASGTGLTVGGSGLAGHRLRNVGCGMRFGDCGLLRLVCGGRCLHFLYGLFRCRDSILRDVVFVIFKGIHNDPPSVLFSSSYGANMTKICISQKRCINFPPSYLFLAGSSRKNAAAKAAAEQKVFYFLRKDMQSVHWSMVGLHSWVPTRMRSREQ